MVHLLIILPLALLFVINLPFVRPLRKTALAFVSAFTAFQMLASIRTPGSLLDMEITVLSPLFAFTTAVDALTMLLLFLIALVSMCVIFLTEALVKSFDDRYRVYNLLLITYIALNGIVMLADMFSMFLFLELSLISSFVLISLYRDADALESSFKYLVISSLATLFMLLSISVIVMFAGSTSFSDVRSAIELSPNSFMVKSAVIFFVAGLLVKGGFFPFHWWLPDAYSSAPSPVSVLLAGIITKVSGIYALLRLVGSVFGFTPRVSAILMAAGLLSIVAGALIAMTQKDMKRMFAYSSISQMGYIIAGFAAATPLAVAGAVFHLFNHATFKTLLFVNAAAVESETGSRDMTAMGGLASKMPVTGATSVIGLLSAAGIPPLAGFWSKLLIIIGLWQAGFRVVAAIALLAGILTMAYLLIMQRLVFFGKLRDGLESIREAHWKVVVPEIILATISIGAGLFFPLIYRTVFEPIGRIFM